MGTSYHTLLVVGELRAVGAALAAAGVAGLISPAGPGRTAVIPREDGFGYGDPIRLAEVVSGAGFAVLSNVVIDSDVVVMRAYRHGRLTHEYVSDIAMLADAVEAPSPTGPRGADPVAVAPFGVDPVDIDRLGAAMRGEFSGHTKVFAEFQHRLILKAMNLEPRGLTTEFRWARVEDLPGAVHIQEVTTPKFSRPDNQPIAAYLHVGLPTNADPLEAAQVIADAVVGGPFPMRADVGYVAVIPAAIADELMMKSLELIPAPRRGTYFVVLYIGAGGETSDSWELLRSVLPMWTAALRARYGPASEQGPVLGVMPSEKFEVGFRAAQGYRSSRTAI